MSVQIKKGIPPPEGRCMYPWLRMDVGDHFDLRTKSTGHAYACQANRRYAPRKFTSRKVQGETYRIWRVA